MRLLLSSPQADAVHQVQVRRLLLQGLPGVPTTTPCLRTEQASYQRERHECSADTHNMSALDAKAHARIQLLAQGCPKISLLLTRVYVWVYVTHPLTLT